MCSPTFQKPNVAPNESASSAMLPKGSTAIARACTVAPSATARVTSASIWSVAKHHIPGR
jgi:hypothetical protein